MKPHLCKPCRPGASPLKAKKLVVGNWVTAIYIVGDLVVVFVVTKSHNGNLAYLGDLVNNVKQINQTEGIDIVDLMFRPSAKKYDRIIVSILDGQGKLIAKAIETYTKPYKKGNLVGNKISCIFAYIENKEPKYLNKVIG